MSPSTEILLRYHLQTLKDQLELFDKMNELYMFKEIITLSSCLSEIVQCLELLTEGKKP